MVSEGFLFEDLPKSLHVVNQPNPAGEFQLVASNYNACLSIKWGRADASRHPPGVFYIYTNILPTLQEQASRLIPVI